MFIETSTDDIRFGHRITGMVSSFDYVIHNSIQIIFHLAHKWSKCVVSEFSEIMWHMWYFCKLYMIKWKRDSGISVAETAEILIPLSCSKTSICKHYYQVSHPYNDVETENRSHDRQSLNTVGMGQDSRLSNCWCSEDITVLHLATGTFQKTYASSSCNSFTLCKLRYCSWQYIYIHDIEQDHCIFIPGVLYIILFCSKPPISYHIIISTLSYKPTRVCQLNVFIPVCQNLLTGILYL